MSYAPSAAEKYLKYRFHYTVHPVLRKVEHSCLQTALVQKKIDSFNFSKRRKNYLIDNEYIFYMSVCMRKCICLKKCIFYVLLLIMFMYR